MTTETQEKIAKTAAEAEKPGMLPSWVVATLQTAILSAISNLMAQGLASYKHSRPFAIDWVPIFQFFVFACLNTPINFAWQLFLEDTFPSYPEQPKPKKKEGEKDVAPAPEPKLSVLHTIIKTVMDQTLGAVINTFLFAFYTYSIQQAMAHRFADPFYAKPEGSLSFLLSGKAVDYSRINWNDILEVVSQKLWPLIFAGWKLWPAVSIVNFAFVKTVEMRNLVGALAGVGWGVYVSLFAAGES
ncbi:hypothetical protein MKZ38_006944 [Zalerion maritima]|uniref:Uncharacterized protein n=1 Tax=Zalerion maritima TaxID=339359 RepID=A0AAD5S380_9PEZI|nr:hypothetical protein MKZ38_006944 [Zalerion maritima]